MCISNKYVIKKCKNKYRFKKDYAILNNIILSVFSKIIEIIDNIKLIKNNVLRLIDLNIIKYSQATQP